VVPFLIIGLTLVIYFAHPNFNKVFRIYDKLNNVVQENLQGIRVVKSYVREDHEDEKFKSVSKDIYKTFSKAQSIVAFNNPILQFSVYVCMLLVSWLGAKFVVGGTLTTGELVSMFTYTMQILMSLNMMSMVFVMVIIARTSAERITEVLSEESDLKNNEAPLYEISDGSVRFKNVCFSYAGELEKLALIDADMEIKSGEVIGIIGGTGSSKSTLVQLIPRLYDVTKGSVEVGGQDVRKYDLKSLRDQVSMVLQNNVLFTGTIKENLRWGNEDATDEDLTRVCKIAQADSFIQEFPDKYDTLISQGGNNVSGGQKQRLCIARALLKKPKILILDDSTSAVDTKTDRLIREGMKEEIPGTTTFIIGQRISSIEDSDRIIVMDNGMINAIGTHESLLKTNHIYQEVYESQQKGFGEDDDRSSRYFGKQQQDLGKVNGFIEEMMYGQKVVKIFNHEPQTIHQFKGLNEELRQSATQANKYANSLMPIMMNLLNIQYVLLAVIGGIFSVYGVSALTIGMIASFLQLSRSLNMPISQVSQQINFVIMALAGAERIFNLIDEKSESDDGLVTLVNVSRQENQLIENDERTGIWAWKYPHEDGTVSYTELTGDVRFDDVSFGYEENNRVLKDINLYAEPGQKVAFVGATGAGKTTITNLINRFYDIQEGKIRYDGINIEKIKKHSLRRSLGIVLQDTHLFTGTIRENIRYGNLYASDEAVIQAAKLANAEEFINHLPDKYDTVITGDGDGLSQGQRQLLAIARAAIADPPVMILDEATSSIDTRTEKYVQAGMDQLMKGRTVFVIAHRLSTIQNSDVIMVMDHGRIIERGTHDELLLEKATTAQNKFYKYNSLLSLGMASLSLEEGGAERGLSMIKSSFKRNDAGHIVSFEVTGHAESGPYGSDVVCAAVSALTISTVNGIDALAGFEPIVETNEDESGYYSGAFIKNLIMALPLQLLLIGPFCRMVLAKSRQIRTESFIG
ncbi:hypothetical protein HW555_014497, partial [Spodoptera exigua]